MLNKLQLKILKKLRELKEEENPTYFYGSMLFRISRNILETEFNLK